MLGSILEICKENLSGTQVRNICDSLQKDQLKGLVIRESTVTDKDYKKIMKVVGVSAILRHLTLNIGIVADPFRIQVLTQEVKKNTSLTGLFIHGNEIGNEGMKILYPSLSTHPQIMSLDLGDCGIGDDGMELVCGMISTTTTRPGLHELVLSHNRPITMCGWTKLGVAMAAGCPLRELYLDYNEMGDASASCILVALPGARRLEVLDLECVGITETSAQILLHILQNYAVALKQVILEENQIEEFTIEAIKMHMPEPLESEQDNDVISDDEPSLATSEPPLDDGCFIYDDNNSSPVNFIQIAGAPDSMCAVSPDSGVNDGRDNVSPERPTSCESSSVWIPGHEGGVTVIAEGGDTVPSRPTSPRPSSARASSPVVHKPGSIMASKSTVSLAEHIKSTRDARRSSISSCGYSEMGETEVAPLFSKSELGSMLGSPKFTKNERGIGGGNPNGIQQDSPTTDHQVVVDGGRTSIEVLEQVEDIEDMGNEELNKSHNSVRSGSLHDIGNDKMLLTVPQAQSRRGSLDILHGVNNQQPVATQSKSSIGRSRRCSAPIITVTNLSVHQPKKSPKRAKNKVAIAASDQSKQDVEAYEVRRRLSTVSSVFGDVAVEEV